MILPKLTRFIALATLIFVNTAVMAPAHEIDPAIADVSVDQDVATIDIQVSLESLLADMDLSILDDTEQAPQAELYGQFRAMDAEPLRAELDRRWADLAGRFMLQAGDVRVPLSLMAAEIPPVGDTDLARTTMLTLRADLPTDDTPVQFGWAAQYGDLVVRQASDDDNAYAGFLSNGDLSDPLPRVGAREDGPLTVFLRYIPVGFEHIVPLGVDHILFVLGLFFFSLHLRPILMQVTAFTIAHTLTLALATLESVSIPGSIVEPLIAASIVYVGIENLIGRGAVKARTALVFVFGLLHGLGFASVLGDFGISASSFVGALLGFNVGVEIAQLAVILSAFVLILIATRLARIAPLPEAEAPAHNLQVMYRSVAVVGSIIISLIGAWWTIERVFF